MNFRAPDASVESPLPESRAVVVAWNGRMRLCGQRPAGLFGGPFCDTKGRGGIVLRNRPVQRAEGTVRIGQCALPRYAAMNHRQQKSMKTCLPVFMSVGLLATRRQSEAVLLWRTNR
jgi:hypothetical protein